MPEVAAARANYESAQAQARLAAADAKRYENLVATGDVSRSAFEKARTQQETADAQANAARQQYEAALNAARQSYGAVETSQASLEGVRAQLAQAEKALADTTIHAPFDGYITARPVAAGEYVALTNKIATIVRIGTMKLQLQTPEQRAARAQTRHDRGRARRRLSRTAISPARSPPSIPRWIPTRASSSSKRASKIPKAELRPGMFATARVLLPGGETAVFVPRSAVVRDKTTDSNQVFAIDNGIAHLRVVVIGDTDGDQIRIAPASPATKPSPPAIRANCSTAPR